MIYKRTARKATIPTADNAVLAFRSYRPRAGANVGRVLENFRDRWNAARHYGISDLEGIQRLQEILPQEWKLWTESLGRNYIRRRPDTLEEEGDFPGLMNVLQLQFECFGNVMPASPDLLFSPPFQWDIPAAESGEGSEPPRPDLPQDFPGPSHDPTGRGKAPAIDVPAAYSEEEYETESPPHRPADPRRFQEVPLPHSFYLLVEEFRAHIDRGMASVHGRLDTIEIELAAVHGRLDAIEIELALFEPVVPQAAPPPPPPAHEDLPGA